MGRTTLPFGWELAFTLLDKLAERMYDGNP